MILTPDFKDCRNLEIRDGSDKMVFGVLRYDTETKEAEMYILDNKGYPVMATQDEPLIAKVVLEGSYVYNRTTGTILGQL